MSFPWNNKFSLVKNQTELFQKFYNELIFFRRLFLTKKETEKEIVRLIEDGIISGKLFLKKAPKGVLVDMGSGAGFPGIVLAVLDSKRKIVLVEPSSRRAEFLRHVVDLLNFQNRVTIREKAFSRIKEKIILFKAFAPLRKTLQMVKKYLSEDGVSYHFKGPRYKEDWDRISSEEKKIWQMKVIVSYLFEKQKRVVLEIKRNL